MASSTPFMTSGSDAVTVKERGSSSLTVWVPCDVATGDLFTSFIVTVTASESLPPYAVTAPVWLWCACRPATLRASKRTRRLT